MGLDHISQSGIQWRPVDKPHQAMQTDKLLRGVVVATYVLDDEDHPYKAGDATLPKPVSVYCDVLCYSNISGMRWVSIPKAMVIQDRGSIHSGKIWKPKAAKIDVTSGTMGLNGGTHLGNLDGDHVLVGFLDGLKTMPIILGGIPHPSRDLGNDNRSVGHRTYLKVADGDPDFFKHHGTFYGIANNGDFVVDTTFANDGELEANGAEAAPPTDGKGAQRYHLPQDAEHRIVFDKMSTPDSPEEISYRKILKALYELSLDQAKVLLTIAQAAFELKLNSGATFKVEGKDALAKLTLGDGAKSAIIAEAFQTWWDSTLKPLFNLFDTHVHPTGVGPSGTPSVTVSLPSYLTTLTSTKVKFPDL